MKPLDRHVRRGFAVPLLFAGLVLPSFLDRPATAKDKEPGDLSATERASQLETMRDIAQSLKVFELSQEQRLPLRLVKEPLLRYADNTRQSHDSTLWMLTRGGRPGALVGVEYYAEHPSEQKWLFELVSLSTRRIAVDRETKTLWTARQPGLQPRSLADAPQPAGKPAARLAQMKQILRRFTAHERTVVEGRIELRPMAQPVYRYEIDGAGTADGAIFAFANGTNPEALLILETEQPAAEKNANGWQFSLAQITGGEVFVELDGTQIWECTEADPPAQRDSYVNGWISPRP